MVAEMELSKVDNKAKLETTLQEEAAIQQDNKDREMERLADAAEKAARVTPLLIGYCRAFSLRVFTLICNIIYTQLNNFKIKIIRRSKVLLFETRVFSRFYLVCSC